MKTVTFQVVLAAILARGATAALSDLASMSVQRRAGIDSAINEAYEAAFKYHAGGWPETVSVAEFTPATQAVTGYLWTPYDTSTNLVSESIFEAYDADPRVGRASLVDFRRGADGIYYSTDPGLTPPSTVWLRWRIEEGKFSATAYDNAATYVVDDVVRYTDGHCYRAILGGSGHLPTNATYWTQQNFMALLEKAVINGAVAVLKQMVGEFDQNAVLAAAMNDTLDQECADLAAKGYLNYPRH